MIVSVIQANLIWEDVTTNLQNLQHLINPLTDIDLIVLPEMFSTGFTMNPKPVAETMDGVTVQWLKTVAQEKHCAVTGSVVILENNCFYNRLLFVFPNGNIQFYDKRHLFTLSGENEIYSAGKSKLIVEYKGWRICPLVCYDLRFPVFSRNVEDYDLLIYVANWPKPRIAAWDALLKARAIENMSYVVGVNRIGKDNNGHEYVGHSQIVDFLGNYLIEPSENASVVTVSLDQKTLIETRQKFPFLTDMDEFTVN